MNCRGPTTSDGGALPPSHADLLTEAFYRWEHVGRGRLLFPHPVAPEPPFRPFSGHFLPETPCVDDGRRPTVLSAALKAAGRMFIGEAAAAAPADAGDELPAPDAFLRERLVELQVLPPVDFDAEDDVQFLLSLALCREPVAFELVATASRVTTQFCLHPDDEAHLRTELASFFPDAGVRRGEAFLANAWQEVAVTAVIGEWGLGREFMCPLHAGDSDLFVPLLGALSDLRQGEAAVFQVLFQPVRHPWAESILAAASDGEGGSFFVNAPEFLKQAREKVSPPLYAAVIRTAVKSRDRAWELMRQIASALQTVGSPGGNELMPLRNDGYPPAAHEYDLLRRQSRRTGVILNVGELAGFVHLPASEVRSPKLARLTVRTKAAPATVAGRGGVLLGQNTHAGKTVPVFLTAAQRSMHCHIVGASGTGKSTLLFNLITQDIESGQGLAVLDPHGDLADRVIAAVPDARLDDVILFDPSDAEYSVGFNFLDAHSELEKRLLASDLVSVFRRLSTSWGDQMNSVLQNAVLAFLESERGGTLADLRRFLLEPSFRNEFLSTVCDTEIAYYWSHAFPLLAGTRSIGPILTRLETFLSPKAIRLIVSQKENKLDFAEMMDSGKIFLAKLAQGLIGRENSHLLGTLLVGRFQQSAMSRQAQATAARRRFWVYLDEAHNFVSHSLGEVLSETRKYSVGLILAHQELRQLERDPEVASAVLSNPHTRIVFRVGDDAARKLGEGFAFFEARDLQNLGTGEAVCRVGRSDHDFNLSVPLPPPVDTAVARDRLERIRAHSRSAYATPAAEVEKQLSLSRGHETPAAAGRRAPSPATAAKPEPPPTAPDTQASGPRSAGLSDLDLRYLQAVIANPGRPSRAYAKLARVSGERALEIRRRLVAAGFLREHVVATGHRGPPALVLEPLPIASTATGKTTSPTE